MPEIEQVEFKSRASGVQAVPEGVFAEFGRNIRQDGEDWLADTESSNLILRLQERPCSTIMERFPPTLILEVWDPSNFRNRRSGPFLSVEAGTFSSMEVEMRLDGSKRYQDMIILQCNFALSGQHEALEELIKILRAIHRRSQGHYLGMF